MSHAHSRRDFLRLLAGSCAAGGLAIAADPDKLPPVRAITKGPKHHWFGYYDKLEFDPTGRYVLGMEVDFEHRSPKPDDVIKVGMVDLEDNDRWTELGESRAWNWQQGCMLQWLPGSKTEVMWNDRDQDQFVCRILDVKSGKQRTLPAPIYALSPDAKWGIAPDFRRLNDVRPGYGYAGLPDPNKAVLAPADSGIWKIDLATGKQSLLLSVADVAKHPNPERDWQGAKHWFNHLLVSPDGGRFIFLHRWRGAKEGQGFSTRMFTASADGKELHVLDPFGRTSHFIWRDPKHILAWALHPSHGERFYLYQDRTDKVEVVGKDVMTVNGHCTYLPGNQWILNDTYPDKERLQHPYLYHVATGKRHPLGHFLSPREYTGEWRCDNHPRFSPDGKKVVIDSPHGGNGRQLYLIDISGLVS
ncbi:MAG: twin-arginine translocation signal domain-containing protein [Planctomycetia bacterium]|nr:twin-arginine translocation signal domain-containing protein [Planctomycetia bacterium]